MFEFTSLPHATRCPARILRLAQLGAATQKNFLRITEYRLDIHALQREVTENVLLVECIEGRYNASQAIALSV